MSNEKDYSATELTVFTLQIASGMALKFDNQYKEIVAYAMANKLEKPKKQQVFTRFMKDNVDSATPEWFFNK